MYIQACKTYEYIGQHKQKETRVCKTGHAPHPPMLPCHSHCYLDLYPNQAKIDREHLLSVTNVCIKFEGAWPN